MKPPVRAGSAADPKVPRVIARNPRARHDYEILEKWEAGLVLTGTEVKALRGRRASLVGAFAHIRREEVWLEALHIRRTIRPTATTTTRCAPASC